MIESTLFPIVSKINEYLSNYILIFLLVGVGLWYSIRTRFVQVRCFGEGMRKFFGELNLRGGAQKSGMTSFQALATAIEDRLAAYWRAEGQAPGLRRAAILFDGVGAHPHLLARLVQEPDFAHLRAIGYTVPGDDGGPTCVLLYLRDLTAITRIDVQQAGAEPISFRLPTPAELATPAAGYNPFRAEASG